MTTDSEWSGTGAPATVDERAIADFVEQARRLEEAVQRIILGQPGVVRETVISLLAGGHALLEGVPGLGKTLLVRTLASALDLSFARIQFTPDLMPADITGTTVLQEGEQGGRAFAFQPGPIFAHLVLADEINRATPKTQSALLEAMQERTVTVGTRTHHLPEPFFVLATQNPLEMEGTYPLPEAQLDRFLLKILVPFPEDDILVGIVRQTLQPAPAPEPVLNGRHLNEMVRVARAVPMEAGLVRYAVSVVGATHPFRVGGSPSGGSPIDMVRRFVRAGVSPRGLQAIVTCAQVRALLEGRYNVSAEDVQAVALPALRHRILLNFEGDAEGVTTDAIVEAILQTIPAP